MTSAPAGLGAGLRPAVVVAGGCALLAFRLWNLRAAPFVYDEPIFLDAARQQVESGHWLSASPITGSRGFRYGPSVFWLYGIAQRALGAQVITALTVMCVLTTASQTFLVAGLTRLASGGRLFFLVLLGLIGSSPYLDLWSRLAWDQIVLISSAAVIGVLCRPAVVGVRHGVAVGLLLGIAMSSHPMAVPLAVAVLGAVGWEMRHRGLDALRVAASALGAMVAVNLPYLHHLATHGRGSSSEAKSFVEPLWDRILQAPSILSAARIEYLFDGRMDRFVDSTTGMSTALSLRGVVLLVVTLGAMVGLASSWRDADPRRRRVARCGVWTWTASVAYYALVSVAQEPHYQFVAWWVIPAGMALAVQPLRRVDPRGGLALTGAAVVICLNGVFVAGWRAHLSADEGTRGVFYGASLGNQQNAVDELCRQGRPGTPLLVVNETAVFPESLDYLVSTTSGCRGREIEICDAPCEVEDERREVRLVYDPDGSARLVVVPIQTR